MSSSRRAATATGGATQARGAAVGSPTNPTCGPISVPQIDAAADGSTGVVVGAQASETQTLAQGDCTWRDSTGANFVEVSTDAGSQSIPEDITAPLSVGSDGYLATRATSPQLVATCGPKSCDFTAHTNADGYAISVSGLFTPAVGNRARRRRSC